MLDETRVFEDAVDLSKQLCVALKERFESDLPDQVDISLPTIKAMFRIDNVDYRIDLPMERVGGLIGSINSIGEFDYSDFFWLVNELIQEMGVDYIENGGDVKMPTLELWSDIIEQN